MKVRLTSSFRKVSAKSHFQLGCSFGSAIFEGESLAAIIDWMNQTKFQEGYIDVCDTLYRYNLMQEGMSEEDAISYTQAGGFEWIKRNKSILDGLRMPYRITRWSDWLEDSRFPDYKQAFDRAFKSNGLFSQSVLMDVSNHFQRKYGQTIAQRSEQEKEVSINFYVEEIAALSLQFEKYSCAEVYPGKELECSKIVRAGKISDVPQGLANANYARLFIDRSANDNEFPPLEEAYEVR